MHGSQKKKKFAQNGKFRASKGTFTAQGWGSLHHCLQGASCPLLETLTSKWGNPQPSATSAKWAFNQPWLWLLKHYIYTHWRESSLTLHYHHWTGKYWYASCFNWGFNNSNVNSTIGYCFLQQNHYYISGTILSFTKIFILTLSR